MLTYHVLLAIHLCAVILSGTLFVLRGTWMLSDSPRLGQRWIKVLPHVNDTVLLAAAVGLTLSIGQYPLTHAWLTAKLVGLLLYIALGMIALRHGRTRRIRVGAFVAALLVFIYIVSVALTHNPRVIAGQVLYFKVPADIADQMPNIIVAACNKQRTIIT